MTLIHHAGHAMSTTVTATAVTNAPIGSTTTMTDKQQHPTRSASWISFYQAHCVYLPAMVGWFFFSALLSSYNKLVFGGDRLAFPCPLLMTSIHFLVQWIFSYILGELFPITFGGARVKEMDWREFCNISVPCGVVTSGDVGLSNLSLVKISITFYTMVKSSTPIFVLLWAYIFNIETITPLLLLVVAIIAAGECLTVLGEVEYDWLGLCMCLGASILSGARWTLVQLKLRHLDPPLTSSIATMRILSPSMFLSMLVLSLAIERPWIKLSHGYFETLAEGCSTLGLGLVGAVFAISMILCEFYLILHANAMVLMIGGVLKEMFTIFVGVQFFDDSLNRINLTGCAIVFSGVALYKVHHHIQHHDPNEKHSRPSTPVSAIPGKSIGFMSELNYEENPQEMELTRILNHDLDEDEGLGVGEEEDDNLHRRLSLV